MEKEIKLSGKTYVVQRFRGLKALLAMAAITRIAREVPDILADAVKGYQRRNTVVITEAMSRLPRWEGFSKEDFDTAEKDTGKREVEIPAVMTQQEQVLAALPGLLENARKEVVRLLSILVIPNDELRTADKEDRVEAALDEYVDLIYDAELDELADLALGAADVLSEQLADRKDRLGKLLGGLANLLRRNQVPSQQFTADSILRTTEESTPSTSPDDAPTSSTPSESHTDGTERQLSMASPGRS